MRARLCDRACARQRRSGSVKGRGFSAALRGVPLAPLSSSSRSPKCNFLIRLCKPKWIERRKYETLSSSSKNFGSEQTSKRNTKGGGPPLCSLFFVGFPATRNCSDWCSSLVFSPFNPFWLAGANQKITFWGPWTYFKTIFNFYSELNICIFLSFIP